MIRMMSVSAANEEATWVASANQSIADAKSNPNNNIIIAAAEATLKAVMGYGEKCDESAGKLWDAHATTQKQLDINSNNLAQQQSIINQLNTKTKDIDKNTLTITTQDKRIRTLEGNSNTYAPKDKTSEELHRLSMAQINANNKSNEQAKANIIFFEKINAKNNKQDEKINALQKQTNGFYDRCAGIKEELGKKIDNYQTNNNEKNINLMLAIEKKTNDTKINTLKQINDSKKDLENKMSTSTKNIDYRFQELNNQLIKKIDTLKGQNHDLVEKFNLGQTSIVKLMERAGGQEKSISNLLQQQEQNRNQQVINTLDLKNTALHIKNLQQNMEAGQKQRDDLSSALVGISQKQQLLQGRVVQMEQKNKDLEQQMEQKNKDLTQQMEQKNKDLEQQMEQKNKDLTQQMEQKNKDLEQQMEQKNKDLTQQMEQKNKDLEQQMEQSNKEFRAVVTSLRQQIQELQTQNLLNTATDERQDGDLKMVQLDLRSKIDKKENCGGTATHILDCVMQDQGKTTPTNQ